MHVFLRWWQRAQALGLRVRLGVAVICKRSFINSAPLASAPHSLVRGLKGAYMPQVTVAQKTFH
jgi:hypothetical protein